MKKIKVLIIDDSTVIREIVKEVLSDDPDIEVIGEAKDPFVARELIKKLQPDLLTLDVEMPKMDGITFLKNLMRLRPMPVVMLSTLTTHGADTTFEALELGAVDFIAKPSFEELQASKSSFKELLISKIKGASSVKSGSKASATLVNSEERVLAFPGCKRINHIIAIGASTGGTEAIKAVITKLPSNSPPIVITLHIPEKFSARFAERMNSQCDVDVQEAKHGQKIKLGNVYIAPGDQHLTVVAKGDGYFCVLENTEPVNRHKPAVDVLFNSLLPYANNVQAVLLTGMGSDGANGLLALKEQGAMTIIQDKKSSLIWGMPGSAFKLNAHIVESPLELVSKKLLRYAQLDKKAMNEVLSES